MVKELEITLSIPVKIDGKNILINSNDHLQRIMGTKMVEKHLYGIEKKDGIFTLPIKQFERRLSQVRKKTRSWQEKLSIMESFKAQIDKEKE